MTAYISYIASMIIFGTIGIFVRYIDLPSSVIALSRGLLGGLCFLPFILFSKKRKTLITEIRANWKVLFMSCLFLVGNWIFLFESYRHTTLAIASILYYIAPLFVLIFAAVFFHEKMQTNVIISVLMTFIGMILLSDASPTEGAHISGIIFGICAAMCYAGMMITNKMLKNMGTAETTGIQLLASTVLLFPYVLCTEKFSFTTLNSHSIILIIILGVIHTGLGFFLFYYGLKRMQAQEIAVLGYIDPLVPVIVSFTVFHEWLSIVQIIGMFLIISAILLGSMMMNRKKILNTKPGKNGRHAITVSSLS